MTVADLKIRLYGDPCLRKKSKPVKEVGPVERMLIQAMIQLMHEQKGIGLAAPQVGINEQIFVADVGEGPFAVINPHIGHRKGVDIMEEGCLSIPGVVVVVKRPQEITLRYRDENNKSVTRVCRDLLARVVLHETDHLNGRLIVDYAGWREKFKLRSQLQEITNQFK
jgi:peptide deformylase